MENNEIYIDGVNVAGCNFRLERDNKQKCECCHATGFGVICDCEAWHNCYYKQLKRLEQENKTLNYQWHKQSEIGDEWYKVAEKYKTALEEIRVFCKNQNDDWCNDIVNKINEVLQ